jgi:hypothetical protein
MFLKLTAAGELQFEDRQNFRAFKLVVESDRGRLDAVRRAVAGKAELADAETAWIFQAALRQARPRAGYRLAAEFLRHDRKGASARLDRRSAQRDQSPHRVGINGHCVIARSRRVRPEVAGLMVNPATTTQLSQITYCRNGG